VTDRDIEHILALGRAGLGSSPLDRQRVLAGLAQRFPELAASAAAAGMLTAAHSAASQAPRPGLWQPLLGTGVRGVAVGLVLIGAGFVAGYAVRGSSVAPAPRAREQAMAEPERAAQASAAPVSTDVAAIVVAAPEPAAVTEPSPAGRSSSADSASRKPAAKLASGESGLERELGLLRRAERALRNHDPALALALLDELEASQPSPVLLEERTATRLLARCASRESEARQQAERFLESHPHSVYGVRLAAACEPDARAEPVGSARREP
jgi:hypothetical protein